MSNFAELNNMVYLKERNAWLYYETDLGEIRFRFIHNKKPKSPLFEIEIKTGEIMGFVNNGFMKMSQIKGFLRDHKAVLLKKG